LIVYVALSLGGKSGAARLTNEVLAGLESTGRRLALVTRAAGDGAAALPGVRKIAAPRRVPFPAAGRFVPGLLPWARSLGGDALARRRLRRLRPELTLVHSLEDEESSGRDRWGGTGLSAMIVHESPRHFSGAPARHDLAWALSRLRRFDALVFVSERGRREWLSLPELAGRRAFHVPNCAREEEVASLLRRPRAEHRAALGIPAEQFLAVCVGTLQPRKGQDRLVDALPALSAAVPGFRLAFLGDPVAPGRWSAGTLEWTAALRRRADEIGGGAAHFLGAREDALRWIRAADVLLLPSRAEAQPLTVLEAMALGTPVVATDVDGVPELIEHDRSGILVDGDSPGQFVAAIGDLAAAPDYRQRLADAARERYRRRFTVEHFRAGYRGLVQELVGPAGAGSAEGDRRVAS
jgi:glycosyltransferase involved in cell wall biosynthesis